MTVNTRQGVFVGALALVLAVLVVRMLGGNPSKATGSEATTATPETQGTAARVRPTATVIIDWSGPPAQNVFDVNRVLPATRPATPPVSVVPQTPKTEIRARVINEARKSLVIQATMTDERAMVLINGDVHKVGDVVAGFTILQIERRTLIVEKDGIQLEILHD